MVQTIQQSQLSDADKALALRKHLEDTGRLRFAEGFPDNERNAAITQLISTLLKNEELCITAVGDHVTFVLYPSASLPQGTANFMLESEDRDIVVAIPVKANDLSLKIEDAVDAAISKRHDLDVAQNPAMPLSRRVGSVTGINLMIGSGLVKAGERPSTGGANDTAEPYNPRADILRPGHHLKHTAGQLVINGKARMDDSDKGSRWIWEMDHKYLLSNEVLRTKTPSRWFRDMCVVCGVSTNFLEQVTDILQSTWSNLQNRQSAGLATQKRILEALSIVLTQPVSVGRPSYFNHYTLPAGSLFGLKTIKKQQADGSTQIIVDPAELDRISMALFGTQRRKDGIRTLSMLSYLSHAYMRGAIKKDELISANIPAAPLHTVIAPYGFDAKYRSNTKEYDSITKFFCYNGINPACVIETLKTINAEHWRIPEAHFNGYMEAIKRFPKGQSLVLTALPVEEAFEFAKLHHDGYLGAFIKTHRKATGRMRQDIANTKKVSSQQIDQIEAKKNNAPVQECVLAPENPWQLPTGENGQIRADVAAYITNFEKEAKKRRPAESFWLTPQQALEQFAGIEQESHGSAPLEHLSAALDSELKKHPGEPFPLVTIGGHDVLVHMQDGKPVFYENDLGSWLQAFARQDTSAPTVDTTADDYWQRAVSKRPTKSSIGLTH